VEKLIKVRVEDYEKLIKISASPSKAVSTLLGSHISEEEVIKITRNQEAIKHLVDDLLQMQTVVENVVQLNKLRTF